jgi:hypothetical protein
MGIALIAGHAAVAEVLLREGKADAQTNADGGTRTTTVLCNDEYPVVLSYSASAGTLLIRFSTEATRADNAQL